MRKAKPKVTRPQKPQFLRVKTWQQAFCALRTLFLKPNNAMPMETCLCFRLQWKPIVKRKADKGMNARFLQKRTREKCRREFVSLLESLFFKHQKSWQAKNARTNLWACNFSSRPLKLIRNGVPKNISPASGGGALLKAQNWWRDDIFLTPVTVLHKNIIWLYTVGLPNIFGVSFPKLQTWDWPKTWGFQVPPGMFYHVHRAPKTSTLPIKRPQWVVFCNLGLT